MTRFHFTVRPPSTPIIPVKLVFYYFVKGLEVLKGPLRKQVKKPRLRPGVPEKACKAQERQDLTVTYSAPLPGSLAFSPRHTHTRVHTHTCLWSDMPFFRCRGPWRRKGRQWGKGATVLPTNDQGSGRDRLPQKTAGPTISAITQTQPSSGDHPKGLPSSAGDDQWGGCHLGKL